ncbi:glycosyltransferase involved in cell wall biosynthesis [Pedobacter sp. UYP30]|uniref:glycosyltransferase family 2 protein n=1 Tax=Pedobacter sp. UYP30 TaxID=1756400 RepID=UPI003395CBB3
MDKIISKPVITVLMAVLNGEKYIGKAIESVLSQSFTDFELLIINDGSTDRTVEVVEKFVDPRIRLIDNVKNKGLFFTRNYGVKEAKGKYIAILDSDDVATCNRLEIQVAFMISNPNIALCGSQASFINENGVKTGVSDYIVGNDLAHHLVIHNIFINSTLMIKKSAIEEVGGYHDRSPAEDYDLSFRISLKYKVANLNDVFVHYREHGNNISKLQTEKLDYAEINIIKDIFAVLNIPENEKLVRVHHDLVRFKTESTDTKEILNLLEILKHGNDLSNIYPSNVFNKMLMVKWLSVLREKKERKIISLYFKNQLFERQFITFKHLRIIIKQAFLTRLFTTSLKRGG